MSNRGFSDNDLREALRLCSDARTAALLKGFEEGSAMPSAGRGAAFAVPTVRRSSGRRIAAALLAAVIALLAFTMAASAGIRQKVLEQVRSIFGDSVSYDFWSEADRPAEEPKLPELEFAVPEGFELVDEIATIFEYEAWYENPDTGDGIHIIYASLDSDFSMGFYQGVEGWSIVKVNGNDADLIPHSDTSNQCNIIWIDQYLNICISIDTTLSEDELIAIAQSIYY